MAKLFKGLSQMAETLPRSGIRAAAALAGERAGLVHLEYGEPSFLTPEPIRRSLSQAVLDTRMIYTPTEGPLKLREAISEKVRKINGFEAGPDSVFVTHGGVGALVVALGSLLDPGDAVLLPDPGWPNTVSQVMVFGGRPFYYPLDPQNGFLPDPDGWEIPANLKLIVINSPSNPTGAVFPKEVMEKIVEVARRYGAYILSDEVYDQIYFDREPVAIRQLCPEKSLAVYSFSKSYAMTGWRLGYLVGPQEFMEPAKKVAEAIYSSTSMVSQLAAMAALQKAGDAIPAMVATYRRRRDMALAWLKDWGLYSYTPEGAFYLMVDVSRAGSSAEVARRLVLEKGVVTVPGSAFGDLAGGALRISLAAQDDDLRSGMEAIRDLIFS